MCLVEKRPSNGSKGLSMSVTLQGVSIVKLGKKLGCRDLVLRNNEKENVDGPWEKENVWWRLENEATQWEDAHQSFSRSSHRNDALVLENHAQRDRSLENANGQAMFSNISLSLPRDNLLNDY